MSTLIGTNIVEQIVPLTPSDNYPTHLAIYGKGGWRTVNSIAERDAIPSERREEGMVVHVIGNGNYKLVGGITNAHWVNLFNFGTPVSTGTNNLEGISQLLARADHTHNTVLHYYNHATTATATTTSTTMVPIADTLINVTQSGTYVVLATVTTTNNTNNRNNILELRLNSTTVPNTTIALPRGGTPMPLVWSISVVLNITAPNTLQIYWSVNTASTATRLGSYMVALRIS
ncbi:MAG: hypothetical protein ABIK31_02760 [candidate division WOR-3 bacterium]